MKTLYQQLEEALRHHVTNMSMPDGTTQDEVYQSIRQIMRENPDIFWFSHQWRYTEDDHTIRFRYTISKEKSRKAKEQIDNVVEHDFLINDLSQLTQAEKVMVVYKWVAMYCKYNIYSAYNQTIFSVFVWRNSVCTGFAKAAQYLFKLLGIESKLVFGTLHNAEKGSRHCWLVVKVDGVWYHIDPTFAVPEIHDLLVKAGVEPVFGYDGLVYNYFCCDTDTVRQSRIIEEEDTLPYCVSTIDHKPLQSLKIAVHRTIEAGHQGVKGCLLSDSGSSASVYLWHTNDKSQKVVKVYKNDSSGKLMLHEYYMMRDVTNSSHVIHVGGTTDSPNGLIIEQSTPLADLLCCHYYQLSAHHFCNLLLDVTEGLQDCLNHGIYYRDIHLNNIYRTDKGLYVLGDFGSCVKTDGKNPSNLGGVGSPWYMAPETYKEGQFDETSATYGVGMLAYFLLNDLYPPLWREEGKGSLSKRTYGSPLPPPLLLKNPSCAFEQQMEAVIKKALAYEPTDRFESLSEIAHAIKGCLALVKDDYLLVGGGTSERLSRLSTTIKDFPKETNDESSDISFDMVGDVENLSADTPIDNDGCCDIVNNIIFGIVNNIDNDEQDVDFESTAITPDILVSNGKTKNQTYIPEQGLNQGHSMKDLIFDPITGDFILVDKGSVQENSDRINDFASTAIRPSESWSSPAPCSPPPSSQRERINDFASTAIGPNSMGEDACRTYQPKCKAERKPENSSKPSFWSNFFGKKNKKAEDDQVFSSVFAPSEVNRKSHMLVQVFLHLAEEEFIVERLATESDPRAERRDYIPLHTRLQRGDAVNIELNVYGESLLFNKKRMVRWQGSFTKCSFDYLVPDTLNIDELSCEINLYVNGVLIGDMRFVTAIVERPQKLNAEIKSRKFERIFISYAHQDAPRVKDFALAYKAQGVDYFYDRHNLDAGDVFEEKIMQYIDSADLFILCWSENAAKSDYVKKERMRAMQHAYPQKNHQDATLKIYPISIEPRTTLPDDMIEIYNFEEV